MKRMAWGCRAVGPKLAISPSQPDDFGHTCTPSAASGCGNMWKMRTKTSAGWWRPWKTTQPSSSPTGLSTANERRISVARGGRSVASERSGFLRVISSKYEAAQALTAVSSSAWWPELPAEAYQNRRQAGGSPPRSTYPQDQPKI